METADQEKDRTTGNDSTEIDRLKEELQREHEMYLRALADYDNYRRRVERERSAAARSGKRELILQLLDVLDGFDRALQHIGDAPSSVSEGVQLLYRKLLSVLEAQGVTPMQSLGETLTPSCTTPLARSRARTRSRAPLQRKCSEATVGVMTCSDPHGCE